MNILHYTEGNLAILVEFDGATRIVPDDMGNRDRQAIADWEAEGNIIPAFPQPVPVLTDYTLAITAMMDAKVEERRYDSALSIATYVGSSNAQWAAEAAAFVAWRDKVWAYCYAEMGKVTAGTRPQPSVADFKAELISTYPLFWPSVDGVSAE